MRTVHFVFGLESNVFSMADEGRSSVARGLDPSTNSSLYLKVERGVEHEQCRVKISQAENTSYVFFSFVLYIIYGNFYNTMFKIGV